jgi:GT2 family glycosyltransferase
MVKLFDERLDIGVATCMLKNKDGSIQGTGGYFPTLLRVMSWMTIQDLPFVDKLIKPFHPHKTNSPLKNDSFYEKERELDWITGAFFMIRKKVIDEVGGFDKDYFMYTEETDLCFRVKKLGWKVWYEPKWSMVHLGGGSSEKWSFVTKEFQGVKTFYKKHYSKWQYPILRLLLKEGAALRFMFYLITGRREARKAYAEAFKMA